MKALDTLQSHLETRLRDLKKMRDRGIKMIGYTPNGYIPEQLVYASGAIPLALVRGGDTTPVLASLPYLGRYIDPFLCPELQSG